MNAKRVFAMGLSLCLLFGVVGCNTTKPVHVLGESGKANTSKAASSQNSSKVANSEKTQSVLSALSEAASKRSVSEAVSKKAASTAAAVSKAASAAASSVASSSSPINTVYGNTPGNINNGGYVAESGDWIYYVNSGDERKLYKINKDGTGKAKLTDYSIYGFINVIGDWVYYVDSSNSPPVSNPTNAIHKIKKDGTEDTIINGGTTLNNKLISCILVINDWIYFEISSTNDYDIYKIKVDGSSLTHLYWDSIDGLNVAGDWIYHSINIGNPGIYRVKTNGNYFTSQIYSGKVTKTLIVNEWIYYINMDDSCLYRISTDGTSNTKITEEKFATYHNLITSSYNVSGDWIYYTEITTLSNIIYKIKIDGTGKMKLSSFLATKIFIVDGWVYYATTSEVLRRVRTDGTGDELVS